MSWQPEVDEIKRRVELAQQMGGPERVARQHEAGRLTVRERIDRLLNDEVPFLGLGSNLNQVSSFKQPARLLAGALSAVERVVGT